MQKVELRKEGMGLPFFGSSKLLDQLSCKKLIISETVSEGGTGSGSCLQTAAILCSILAMARA